MELGLKGKKALVTGASSGLGFAAALALAEEGVELSLNSRNIANLEKAANKINDRTGIRPLLLPGDISSTAVVRDFQDKVHQVDILISNVGGPPPGQFLDHSPDKWEAAGEQLLDSAINLTRLVLPDMLKRGWGRLIYITSIAALQPIDDLILSNTYRAGITGFCKTISNNYSKRGITANCVCPGYTATERVVELAEKRGSQTGQTVEQVMKGYEALIPTGRLGRPEELASLITFLASDRAAYITGCSIPVDGGFNKSLI